jgi:hypothetical protein
MRPASAASSEPEERAKWVEAREALLRKPDGYLALSGLFWLTEGEQTFGSGNENDVVVANGRGPAKIGRFHVRGKEVRFVSAPGVEITASDRRVNDVLMVCDTAGEPTKLRTGDLTFWLIERYGMLGIRLRDPESPVLKGYRGTPRYAYSPAWRLEATYEPVKGARIRVPSILGEASDEEVTGRLHFQVDGKPITLHATGQSNGELFIIFGDGTNHGETYHGGRFLKVAVPKEGDRGMLDFNRAYNPPCAYSPYTTCPLVPTENELPFRIEAGERMPKKGGQ